MGRQLAWLSPAVVVVAGATLVASIAFVRRMLRHHDPLIPVGVLRDRTVTVASWLGFTLGVAVFALVGYLPTIVQTVLGIPATESGALLLALILGMMLTVFASASWIARTGRYRRLPAVGCALGAVALAALSGLDPTWGLVRTAAWVCLLGIGVGCFMQLVTTMAQDAVSAAHVGSATSTVSLVRELGVTIGAATIGSVLAAHTESATLFLVLAGILATGGAVSFLLPHKDFAAATGHLTGG
jgi:predicted MFS family arabinose efflux permease